MKKIKMYIEIEGLLIKACHGVATAERITPNDFRLDLRLHYDARHAMCDDNVGNALDYAAVVEICRHVMARPSMLLENVVERLHSELLLTFPNITGGYIRLAKLHVPIDARVASCAFVYEW